MTTATVRHADVKRALSATGTRNQGPYIPASGGRQRNENRQPIFIFECLRPPAALRRRLCQQDCLPKWRRAARWMARQPAASDSRSSRHVWEALCRMRARPGVRAGVPRPTQWVRDTSTSSARHQRSRSACKNDPASTGVPLQHSAAAAGANADSTFTAFSAWFIRSIMLHGVTAGGAITVQAVIAKPGEPLSPAVGTWSGYARAETCVHRKHSYPTPRINLPSQTQIHRWCDQRAVTSLDLRGR